MTNLKILASAALVGAFTMAATTTSAVSASGTSIVTAATQTLDAKKKCKKGYRYSHARKKCVKKAKRGSY